MKVTERASPRGSIAGYGSAIVSAWRALPRQDRFRIGGWAAWTTLATVAFVQPLTRLLALSNENSLHSHTLLVPFVSAYLIFINRSALPGSGPRSIGGAVLMGILSAGALAAAGVDTLSGTASLALLIVAYLTVVVAGGFVFMGARWVAAVAFPLAVLVFMVPLPDEIAIWLEDALVLASADVAAWLIQATGTPLLRNGTIFTLPTIVFEVARECSGIRSTWVLFITSVVASHMFLKSPWRRLVLVAFVIPLGIVRNGFRILTIALLCVHVGPHMIDSVIHHRGGPIFFVLSLVPLFLLLAWLRRGDHAA